jgi:hypothetical protein
MPADPEVPEADALEQAQPVGPETVEAREASPPSKRRAAFEVPEADALDQAREVPLDDDDRR